MDTTENNKLIAEFMGWELKHNSDINQRIWSNENSLHKMSKEYTFSEYVYSWDKLMPVVEKCLCTLEHDDDLYTKLHDALWSINISEVYTAVLEFINWYNLNKSL